MIASHELTLGLPASLGRTRGRASACGTHAAWAACHDEGMARFRKGDRVLITEGAFKGQWAVIVDKDVIGDELTVALGEDGREIRTHEAHVEPAD